MENKLNTVTLFITKNLVVTKKGGAVIRRPVEKYIIKTKNILESQDLDFFNKEIVLK